MAKKQSVYNIYNWDILAKRLKLNVDRLARKQRNFTSRGYDEINTRIDNQLDNSDLFQRTNKGYISKGMKFYKDKNITYLQRAIAELERFNNNKMFSSVKHYEKMVTGREEKLKEYLRMKMEDRGLDLSTIEQILRREGIVNDFIHVMNENKNSKIASGQIANIMLNAEYDLYEKSLTETINTFTNNGVVTNRLFNR